MRSGDARQRIWFVGGGLLAKGGVDCVPKALPLARAAVRPKPRFLVWRGRGLCGGCLLEMPSRNFCQAIPVVPPRPVSAEAAGYRSAECPARTLSKSASDPHACDMYSQLQAPACGFLCRLCVCWCQPQAGAHWHMHMHWHMHWPGQGERTRSTSPMCAHPEVAMRGLDGMITRQDVHVFCFEHAAKRRPLQGLRAREFRCNELNSGTGTHVHDWT